MRRTSRSPEQVKLLIKTIRNTTFTVIVVVLTGVGVAWNKRTVAERQPVAIGQTVLAEVSSGKRQDFKLKVELSRSTVKLGQYQVITITALPFSNLHIVATSGNGNYERPETRRVTADETGRYSFRFKVADFHDLGMFTIAVKASSGAESANATETFTVQAWGKDDGSGDFVYPLLP